MLRGSCRPQASNCVPFCSFCPALLLLALGCGTLLDVSSEENILSIFCGFQIIKLLKLGCLLGCERQKCLGGKSDFNFHLPLNSPSAFLWHCSPVQTRRMESTKTRLRPSLLIFKAGRQSTVWRSSRTCSRVGIPAARWNIVGDPVYIPGSPANTTCSMTAQPLACPGRETEGMVTQLWKEASEQDVVICPVPDAGRRRQSGEVVREISAAWETRTGLGMKRQWKEME